MKKGPEIRSTIEAIIALTKSKDAKLFRRLASDLKGAKRQRPQVNLKKISRYTKPNGVVVIPGKVLSFGDLKHPVEIVALKFSEPSKKKIAAAGGKIHDFHWLIKHGAKDVTYLK